MKLTHPFGLALSGGGFRAAAFHLGVLRRLREVGLLAQVDMMSTVSGGSITGAYWVYWQALKGDTLADAGEWQKFEDSLVEFMRSGVRERIFRKGFVLPALLLGAAVCAYAWAFAPIGPGTAFLLASAALGCAYVVWHRLAPMLLEREYERLFGYEVLRSLAPHREQQGSPFASGLLGAIDDIVFGNPRRKFPDLYINATLLNTGAHVFFSRNQGLELELCAHDASAGMFKAEGLRGRAAEGPAGGLQSRVAAINEAIDGLDPFMPGLTRRQISLPMPDDTPFSKAVASSSAIPFVFSPIPYGDPIKNVEPSLRNRIWRSIDSVRPCWSVDGGVFDNQGTHLLLEKACSSVIVSDGCGALASIPKPSTWQMFPPGKGVVSRSFDITYERSRDLGYMRLANKYELFCMLTDFSKLIGMPELAPAVVDAVWQSKQDLAGICVDPERMFTHPREFAEELASFMRKRIDPEHNGPYDEEFLKKFKSWTPGVDDGEPRGGAQAIAYLRHQLLKKLEKYAPYVTGYAYVELTPDADFGWRNDLPRLPEPLIPFVASIRTDLDRFTSEEISALMFHGYTTIDHCLWAYRNDWLAQPQPPSSFTWSGKGIFRNWNAPTQAETIAAARHLSVSSSRLGPWRALHRLLKRSL
ncbi:hypothetical protein MesoLjLb_30300 [Mesorhizobium sp. L-8-3]|nr:hypothetical protein MesoLjLb_30300 [Mesorhizobium sp. L-8-3]